MDSHSPDTPKENHAHYGKPLDQESPDHNLQNPEAVVVPESRSSKKRKLQSSLNCTLCAFTTRNQMVMGRHMAVHERTPDGKMHECSVCQQQFGSRANLERHMVAHNKDKLVFCRYCSKEFFRTDQMAEHMMVHIKLGFNFQCPVKYCEEKLFHYKDLDTHMKEVHKISSENRVNCKKCNVKFSKSRRLQYHFFSRHEHTFEDPPGENSEEPRAKGAKLEDVGEENLENSGVEVQNPTEEDVKLDNKVFQQLLEMVQNQEYEVQNPESEVQNRKSEIQNPDSEIQNPESPTTFSELSQSQTPESSSSPTPDVTLQSLMHLETYSNPSTSSANPFDQFQICTPCGIMFKDPLLFSLHKSLHANDEDPFKCGICGFQCENKYIFTVHTTTGNHMKSKD